MQTFSLYLANTHGKKLSGFTLITAATFSDARAEFRRRLSAKGIRQAGTEVLAAI